MWEKGCDPLKISEYHNLTPMNSAEGSDFSGGLGFDGIFVSLA